MVGCTMNEGVVAGCSPLFRPAVCGVSTTPGQCSQDNNAVCQFSSGMSFVASLGMFSGGQPTWALVQAGTPSAGVQYTFVSLSYPMSDVDCLTPAVCVRVIRRPMATSAGLRESTSCACFCSFRADLRPWRCRLAGVAWCNALSSCSSSAGARDPANPPRFARVPSLKPCFVCS